MIRKVGIVGHRFFTKPEKAGFVAQQCENLLKELQAKNQQLTALSALAIGADSIFARKALVLGIPLQVVRPFTNYEKDFTTVQSKQEYLDLRNKAQRELIMPHHPVLTEAYVAAMNWIVSESDLLLVVWDGQDSRGRGGTADAVFQAIEKRKLWIHIDVTNQTVVDHTRPIHQIEIVNHGRGNSGRLNP